MPADSIAPAIREREAQIARLEVKLRQPRPVAPNIEKLREALTQRAEEWRETLRSERKVARLLLRKLIGSLELVGESQRPDWIDADTEVKPALLEGIHEGKKWRPQRDTRICALLWTCGFHAPRES